jgi:hypothetical protein
MKREDRICSICKGLINLKKHNYYLLKNPERNKYYCKSCLEYRCRNCKEIPRCYVLINNLSKFDS